MLNYTDIQNIITNNFNSINWNVTPKNLYEPIDYTLSVGGKRLRPTLVLMAANLFSEDVSTAISPAIGLEIFHNFTLLHDDVMDKAPLRRKRPTVHVKWNENTAILSGDAMLIKAYQYFAQIPKTILPKALNIFSQTALEVCEGQQLDMDFETRENVNESEYIEMIRLKTAVLLAACLKIGALLGNANDEDAVKLYQFGINIGIAFQLKDDLLDVYGNPKTFGKQIGGDILCNKKTFMLISAKKLCNVEQLNKLNYWLSISDETRNEEKIKAVTKIFDEVNVKALCKKKMDEYFATGMQYLNKVTINTNKKITLEKLATDLMSRNI